MDSHSLAKASCVMRRGLRFNGRIAPNPRVYMLAYRELGIRPDRRSSLFRQG